MPRQPITVYQNPDGLVPLATTKHVLGNRSYPTVGSNALRVFQLDGNLNNGSRIAIKTDGTFNFGAPDRRWNSLSVIGENVQQNGVANTWLQGIATGTYFGGRTASNDGTPNDPNSLWDGVVGVKKIAGGRGSIPYAFRGYGLGSFKAGAEGGYVNWPVAFSGPGRVAAAGELMYATLVKKTYSNVHKTLYVGYTGISGTFQTGTNGLPTIANGAEMIGQGERMSITGASGTALGYVRYVDIPNSLVYFEIDQPNTWSMSGFTNAVVTGQISGATLTLNTATYGSEGSQKDARILEAAINNNGGVIGIAATSLRMFYSQSYFQNGTTASSTTGNFNMLPNDWHRITIWADYRNSGSNYGKLGIIVNGQTLIQTPEITHRTGLVGPILANWGAECSIANCLATDYGELVTYTDIFSVVISDSATWGGVNHLTAEPQLLRQGRTSSQAYLNINTGAMGSIGGKYLYALSSPDTPLNANGIQLSF